ncbi:ACT domain-containing protein [uncultured Schumannella sp.]|uniref:ACT domain-containing protein n=1 Tax=uncultured Schumannella sp. TaxID=1195956 RepID=UPI0025F881FC|nr:ACT domain-containing protein [uncultured Schumannella sp.]
MAGIRDLNELLAAMAPVRRPGEFVFVAWDPSIGVEHTEALIREPEGLCAVVERKVADARGLDYEFVGAWITLEVTSALDAVGLTAAFATALAEAGISCNVLAGRHHDHLLVGLADAESAMGVLTELSRRASGS